MHMARPPATTEAPNALAAYMRQYRAWKSGRGAKPAGRATFVVGFEIETLGAELDRDEAMREAEAKTGDGGEWARLRSAVLAAGGIKPNRSHWTADYYGPGVRSLIRRDGLPLDLLPRSLYGHGHSGNFDRVEGEETGLELLDRIERTYTSSAA